MFITTNGSWRGLFSLLPRPPPRTAGADNGFSCAPLPVPASSMAVPGWRNLVDAIALGAIGCARTRAGSMPVPGTRINLSKHPPITQPSPLALCNEGACLQRLVSQGRCGLHHQYAGCYSGSQTPPDTDANAFCSRYGTCHRCPA